MNRRPLAVAPAALAVLALAAACPHAVAGDPLDDVADAQDLRLFKIWRRQRRRV